MTEASEARDLPPELAPDPAMDARVAVLLRKWKGGSVRLLARRLLSALNDWLAALDTDQEHDPTPREVVALEIVGQICKERYDGAKRENREDGLPGPSEVVGVAALAAREALERIQDHGPPEFPSPRKRPAEAPPLEVVAACLWSISTRGKM